MIIDQSSQGSGESSALPTFDIGSKLAELKQTRKLGTAITMKVVTNFNITNNMLLFTINNNICLLVLGRGLVRLAGKRGGAAREAANCVGEDPRDSGGGAS